MHADSRALQSIERLRQQRLQRAECALREARTALAAEERRVATLARALHENRLQRDAVFDPLATRFDAAALKQTVRRCESLRAARAGLVERHAQAMAARVAKQESADKAQRCWVAARLRIEKLKRVVTSFRDTGRYDEHTINEGGSERG